MKTYLNQKLAHLDELEQQLEDDTVEYQAITQNLYNHFMELLKTFHQNNQAEYGKLFEQLPIKHPNESNRNEILQTIQTTRQFYNHLINLES